MMLLYCSRAVRALRPVLRRVARRRVALTATQDWEKLGIGDKLVEAVGALGLDAPTDAQRDAIPLDCVPAAAPVAAVSCCILRRRLVGGQRLHEVGLDAQRPEHLGLAREDDDVLVVQRAALDVLEGRGADDGAQVDGGAAALPQVHLVDLGRLAPTAVRTNAGRRRLGVSASLYLRT